MMKQNLANRLAAGGFWALQVAQFSVEVARHLREEGVELPAGMETDTAVFAMSGVGAFEYVCNVYMDGVRIHMEVQVPREFRDKYGEVISREQWEHYVRDTSYHRIAVWRSPTDREYVFTVWTGVDMNGCNPPHIFETSVVRFHGVAPRLVAAFKSTCLAEAREKQHRAVRLVQGGQL